MIIIVLFVRISYVHILGLGTSTSKEAKEYFSDMKRHRIPFQYTGVGDDEAIKLVLLLHSMCDA